MILYSSFLTIISNLNYMGQKTSNPFPDIMTNYEPVMTSLNKNHDAICFQSKFNS